MGTLKEEGITRRVGVLTVPLYDEYGELSKSKSDYSIMTAVKLTTPTRSRMDVMIQAIKRRSERGFSSPTTVVGRRKRHSREYGR
jgi:hypothetical protein